MEIMTSKSEVDYDFAVAEMEARAAQIRAKEQDELLWFVEHPPLYTAGTSAKDSDLVEARFPVYQTGRGGQYTYHGPGQRVIYAMLDLKKRQETPDIKRYVWQLEEWMIRTLAEFGVIGERRAGRVGIWVARNDGTENKIGAIGVRVRHWVTYHGLALNVDPDLSHFGGIVPCGVNAHGVTSLRKELDEKETGHKVTMADVDAVFQKKWKDVF